MSISDEANKLRVDIVRCGTSHGRRYPAGLKEQILAFIEHAKSAGVPVSESCRRIGISTTLLSNWRAAIRAAETKALVPVEVTDEHAPREQLAFVAPSGFRVEGVSIAQAIELRRALA
jgi:transposase-like protein